jgi:hypothetical protein
MDGARASRFVMESKGEDPASARLTYKDLIRAEQA